jgi:predicted acetyltransferase
MQTAKDLYKLCFSVIDDDDFVNFYFEKRVSEKTHFQIERNNICIAALQAIPYKMTFCGKIVETAYLSAICTHPLFRKRGLMTELLNKTHKKLFADGVIFSTLIPATDLLAEMYAKYGFQKVFHRTVKTIDV